MNAVRKFLQVIRAVGNHFGRYKGAGAVTQNYLAVSINIATNVERYK